MTVQESLCALLLRFRYWFCSMFRAYESKLLYLIKHHNLSDRLAWGMEVSLRAFLTFSLKGLHALTAVPLRKQPTVRLGWVPQVM